MYFTITINRDERCPHYLIGQPNYISRSQTSSQDTFQKHDSQKPFSSKDCWNCESNYTCLPACGPAPACLEPGAALRAALKAAGSDGLRLEHLDSDWTIQRNINLQHQYYLVWFRLILYRSICPHQYHPPDFSLSNLQCVNIVWSFNPILKFTPYSALRTHGF